MPSSDFFIATRRRRTSSASPKALKSRRLSGPAVAVGAADIGTRAAHNKPTWSVEFLKGSRDASPLAGVKSVTEGAAEAWYDLGHCAGVSPRGWNASIVH